MSVFESAYPGLALDHLKRAWSMPNLEPEHHLTAALVYAVLALNDSVRLVNESICEVGNTISYPTRRGT